MDPPALTVTEISGPPGISGIWIVPPALVSKVNGQESRPEAETSELKSIKLLVPSAWKVSAPARMVVRLVKIMVPPAAAWITGKVQAWPVILVSPDKLSTLPAPVTVQLAPTQFLL